MADWLKKVTGALKLGKPLAESLPEMLNPGDPRVAIRPFGDDWLCPFTGIRVVAPAWNGSSLTVLQCPEIKNHLLNNDYMKKKGSSAEMKSWEDLIQIVLFMRIEKGGNYKVSSEKGEWVCPYCLVRTDILVQNWDGSEVEVKMFVPQLMAHFKKCSAYQEDPLNPKEVKDILDAGGDRAVLTKLMMKDPRFRLTDENGFWICPYAARSIKRINLRMGVNKQAQEAILDYLVGPECPGRYAQWEITRSAEELKLMAAQNERMLG